MPAAADVTGQARAAARPPERPARNGRAAWLWYLVLAAAVGGFVLSARALAPYSPDDAFIGYRYAENLATGQGLAFNPGERPVEAYSNFLWILVCALLHAAGLPLPYAAPRLGILIGAASVAVLWLIYRRGGLSPLGALLPLLILSTSGPFALYAISGMETPLFGLLLLTTMLAVHHLFSTRTFLAYLSVSAACILLALSRPEGFIAFPIIALYVFIVSRRGSGEARHPRSGMTYLVIASLVFLGAMLMYNAWRVYYFGEALPTPLLSKGGAGGAVTDAWVINRDVYFKRQGSAYAPFGYYYLALTLIAAAGVSLSRFPAAARHTASTAFILSLAYLLLYPNFVDWMPGMRYYAPLVGLLLIPAVHIQSPRVARFRPRWDARRVVRSLTVGGAILALSVWGLATLGIYAQGWETLARTSLVPLARWLRDTMPRDSLLATSDVGIVPYFSGLRTMDIHPKSLTDLHIARNGFSADYFLSRKPSVVMLTSYGLPDARIRREHSDLVKDSRFTSAYRLVGVLRYSWFDDASYRAYVRRDLPVSDEHLARFPSGLGTVWKLTERASTGEEGPAEPYSAARR